MEQKHMTRPITLLERHLQHPYHLFTLFPHKKKLYPPKSFFFFAIPCKDDDKREMKVRRLRTVCKQAEPRLWPGSSSHNNSYCWVNSEYDILSEEGGQMNRNEERCLINMIYAHTCLVAQVIAPSLEVYQVIFVADRNPILVHIQNDKFFADHNNFVTIDWVLHKLAQLTTFASFQF